MGNSSGSLGVPDDPVYDVELYCTLCHNIYRNPFTLKCSHRFCKRCIGELWSDSATGPYYCPECKDEYRTLPFERHPVLPIIPVWRTGLSNVRTSSGFSLSKGLLGKRAASSPAPDQPCKSKRPARGLRGPSGDGERPTTSSSLDPSRPPDPVPPRQEERPPSGTPGGSSIRSDRPPPPPVPGEVTPANAKSPREATPLQEAPGKDKHKTGSKPPARGAPISPVKTPGKTATPTEREDPTGHAAGDTPAAATTTTPARPSATPAPETSSSSSASSAAGPVPCHYCPASGPRPPPPAVKTCLVCGASMCAEHLRPHLESPVFQSHTLVAPVGDLAPWRCGEHQEMTRIYCRRCDACVCTVCTVIGSHRDHACVGIREAEAELRGNLKDQMVRLQESEQALLNRLSELTEKKQASQLALRAARLGVQQQYGALREALEQEEQQALLCVSQEESRAVGSLEGQLGVLGDSLASVQQGLHALEGLADATGPARVREQAFITEYSKVTQSVRERQCGVEQLPAPEEVNQARLTSLQQWTEKRLDAVVISLPDRDPFRLLYGISPSLDPDTAHPKLLLSEANRKVAYTEAPQDYPEQEARFTGFPQVLAARPLEEGRWYWEVEAPGELGRWKIGVCEGRIGRKGQKDGCRLGFNPYSWCLLSERGKVEALHDKAAVAVSVDELRRVGVFLDFEGGSLSFYRVAPGGALTLLHSFQQRFAEPLYPTLAVSKTRLTVADLFHTPASD